MRTAVIAVVAVLAVSAGLIAWPDRGIAQTYRSLCIDTPQTGSPECAALEKADDAFKAATAALPSLTHESPDALCSDIIADTDRCVRWRQAYQELLRVIEQVHALKTAGAVSTPRPTDTRLPVVRITSATEQVETGDLTFHIPGLVGDDGSSVPIPWPSTSR